MAAGRRVRDLDGPVGVGKSHVAQALGHLAVRHGAAVRFLKTSRALAHLAGGRADGTWHKRLGELARPAVPILDDFAMRALPPPRPTTSTSRSPTELAITDLTSEQSTPGLVPADPYPVVAESLLDRLINNSHQLFMNGPSYRPNKRPGQRGGTTTKEASQ